MRKNRKNAQAREKHLRQKRRNRCKKIITKHYNSKHPTEFFLIRSMTPDENHIFQEMLNELLSLNIKYLEALHSDLIKKDVMYPWNMTYTKALLSKVESAILERTILK